MISDYNNLSHIHNSVDKSIRKFENLALLTANNFNLKPYYLDQSFFNYYQALSTLRYIKSTNELLSALILYDKSRDVVISNFSTIPKQYFGNKVFSASLDNKIPLKDFIETAIQPVYTYGNVNISGVGERRCLLYVYPTSSDFDQTSSIIVMIVDIQNIIDLFAEQYDSHSGSVFILDSNDNIVAHYGNANHKVMNDYLQYNGKSLNGSEVFEYQGNKYCVSKITSLKTGWKYIRKTQGRFSCLKMRGRFLWLKIQRRFSCLKMRERFLYLKIQRRFFCVKMREKLPYLKTQKRFSCLIERYIDSLLYLKKRQENRQTV